MDGLYDLALNTDLLKGIVQSVNEIFGTMCFIPSLSHNNTVIAATISYPLLEKDNSILTIASGTTCLSDVCLEELLKHHPKESIIADMHAEMLAIGALISNYKSVDHKSFILYCSHVPCGDASIVQENDCSSSNSEPIYWKDILRGHACHRIVNVPRTKPGRLDSPPTSILSCTDKIKQMLIYEGKDVPKLAGLILPDSVARAHREGLKRAFPLLHIVSIPVKVSLKSELVDSNESIVLFRKNDQWTKEVLIGGFRQGAPLNKPSLINTKCYSRLIK